MSSKSKVTVPVVVPDVEPEVEVPDVEPEVPVAPPVVTRAEALIAEAEVPEPEQAPVEDYEAYLAAEAARREAWIHG